MVLNGANQILEILQWNRRNELFWMPRQFDLTKWAGQSISIEVGTYNDGQGFTTNMYVDDVTLTMCDDPLPSAAGLQPAGGQQQLRVLRQLDR